MEDQTGVLKQRKRNAWLFGGAKILCFIVFMSFSMDYKVGGAFAGALIGLIIFYRIWKDLHTNHSQRLNRRRIVILNGGAGLLILGLLFLWRGTSIGAVPYISLVGAIVFETLYSLQFVGLNAAERDTGNKSPELTA